MYKTIFAFLLATSSLSAFDSVFFPFELGFSGGWRRDAFTSTENAHSSGDSTLWRDQLRANGMNIWQYGVKFRAALSGLTFYERSFFLDNFYFRGSAYRGSIDSGTFREGPFSHFISSSEITFPSSSSSSHRSHHSHHSSRSSNSFNVSSPSDSSSSSSSSSPSWSSSSLEHQWIRHGCSLDADIAFGFNFPIYCWFNFAPVFGYSFDKLKIELRDDNIREQYTTKWKGPFVGIDLAGEYCYFRYRGGYEYHWGQWEGLFDIKSKKKEHHPHFPSYHDKRNGNAVRGHVAWIDLRWSWTLHLDLGIGLKYQYFQLPRGRITEKDHHPLSSEAITLRNVSWRSLGIMGEIVYRF